MARQTVTQQKNTVKASFQRESIESTNTHTCAESDHRISPNVKCEKFENNMFQIPSLALKIKPRVWWWAVEQHTLFACSTQPLHTLSKEKTHSLTLLLQNHLDHLNILLLGVVGTSTRAVARAFAKRTTTAKKHRSKAAE